MIRAALKALWACFSLIRRPERVDPHALTFSNAEEVDLAEVDLEWETSRKIDPERVRAAFERAYTGPMVYREMTDDEHEQLNRLRSEVEQIDAVAPAEDIRILLDSGIIGVNKARRLAGFSSILEASPDGFISLKEIEPAIVEEEPTAKAPTKSVRGCVIELGHPFVMALVKAVGLEGTPVTKLSLHFERGGFATFDATFLVQESDELDAFVDSLRAD
jgi:hypothetical protein